MLTAMDSKLRLVFMGTPAFAVPSLDALVQNGYPIAGVITAPDKLGGRGRQQLLQSPIKQYATTQGLPVLQPTNLKSVSFQQELAALQADLFIVVAFRMLPRAVWSMPPRGCFNLHGSLLPRYRGAAPIHWAVINGETTTGVTTFFLQEEIDTGAILRQASLAIGPDETTGEVHDRMMELGAKVVVETVKLIETGQAQPQPQDATAASYAPKLFHEMGEVNFNQPAVTVHNFIRGLSPFPGAWTHLDGQECKLLRSKLEPASHSYPPGKLLTDQKSYLKYAASDGFVHILELQLQGRRRLPVTDFLNGYRIREVF